jgi:hypothetical protein
VIRRIALVTRLGWTAAILAAAVWSLSQNPFAVPVIARSADEIRLALTRAVARAVTPGWLIPRLAAAVEAGAPDDIRLYLDLAAERRIAIPDDLAARAAGVIAASEGVLATLGACGGCMADITACESLALISACALPFELSPLGDLNALRRAGVAWFADEQVDELEVALASVGLAATAAVIASGGTSATVKLGATVVRLARRMGALQPGLLRAFRGAVVAGDDFVLLGRLAGDVGRVRAATSTAETLTLLRLADTPDDLARLARLAEAAGPDTRKAVAVLGPARALRLVDRVAGIVVMAIAALAALIAEAGLFLVTLVRWVLRPLAAVRPRR